MSTCQCGAEWGGLRTAHCASCHRTYTGIAAFDTHRHRGSCLHPEQAGLVDAGRGYPCFGFAQENTYWREDT